MVQIQLIKSKKTTDSPLLVLNFNIKIVIIIHQGLSQLELQ